MEVAKYIGLFLLKNNSCYIHGLANLELKRISSFYDGTSLIAPTREISIAPATVIDDTLANFIATNEQISITKASTALKEYSEQTKAALIAGKEVPLATLGKFAEVNGKIHFITDPHFQYQAAPIALERNMPKRPGSEAAHQKPSSVTTSFTQPAYTPPVPPFEEPVSDSSRINWARILLVVLLLGILAAGVIYGLRFMKSGTPAVHIDTLSTQMPVQDEVVPIDNPLAVDSSEATDTMIIDESVNANNPPATTLTNPATITPATNTTPAVAPPTAASKNGPMTSFKVILNTYDDKAKAEKRLKRLRSYGNNVEMYEEDSNLFRILMPITVPVKDKKHMLDSLQRNFNPDGVEIF